MRSLHLDVVVGARPNFVKVASLWRAFDTRRAVGLALRLVHTGQHYDQDLSESFFPRLGLPEPDVRLGAGSGPHGAQTGKILTRYEEHVLGLAERPAALLVVGDVNSTMACALGAAKLSVPVVHIEAGLRCFDRSVPEEINRVVTDAVSDILLASEPSGARNLAAEGVSADRVQMVGSLMIDSLLHVLEAARTLSVHRRLGLVQGRYAYVTLHRPSNVDDPNRLLALVTMIESLAKTAPVVFPTHPRTSARLREHGLLPRLQRAAHLLPPLRYREAIGFLDGAGVVLTDSGGIQEEASQLGVRCITLRTSTERPATVELGTNVLCGDDLVAAEHLAQEALARGQDRMPAAIPGWDGRAAERVVDVVIDSFGRAGSHTPRA